MEQIILKIPVREGQMLYSDEDLRQRNQFIKEHEGQVVLYSLEEIGELRSSEANRYYRGVILPKFVPEHFQTPQAAHIHFTNLYLSQTDVIVLDEENPTEILERIIEQSRKSSPSVNIQKKEDRFIINWVKSTTSLKRKEMREFMDYVMLDGNELGYEFPEPKK